MADPAAPSSASPVLAETLLFVYGTLRRGLANHALLADARFVGAATTAERFALFFDGIPFLAPGPPVHHVRGEVYAVDATTLAAVDRLEGHPQWYHRRPIVVVLDADAEAAAASRQPGERFADAPTSVACEAYFQPRPTGVLSASGDYAADLRRQQRSAARRGSRGGRI